MIFATKFALKLLEAFFIAFICEWISAKRGQMGSRKKNDE